MSQAIDGLGSWLADLYFFSTVLLVLAGALILLLEQPARRMAVARATLAGLCVIAVLSALPAWPRLAKPGPRASATDLPTSMAPREESIPGSSAAIPMDRNPAMPHVARFGLAAQHGQSPAAAPAVEPRGRLEVRSLPTLGTLAVCGFLFGCWATVAWLVLGAVRVGRLRAAALTAPARLEDLLARLAATQQSVPPLRLSNRISLPAAIGVFHPWIVIPERFADTEPDARLAAALGHEWGHIQNGDLLWLAIGRLLLPLFFAHPIYWWLRQRIRLDQEVLADASATEWNDRTAYAEILLDWARQTALSPTDRFVSALALWQHPSQLRRRIAVLLDPGLRIERGCPRGWKLGTWSVAIVSAVLMSLATLHPAPGRAEPEPPASSGPQLQPASAADQVVFQGRVVDPEGKPYTGAKVYLGYYWETQDEKPAVLRATSELDGRFKFAVEKSLFQHIQSRDLEPWNEARLLAVAPGFGLALSDSQEPDASHHATLKLAHDDVPITGRLLDLEGQPVAEALVRVRTIHASPSGALNAWIAGAREGKKVSYELDQIHLPVEVYMGPNPCPVPETRTDEQGRFRLEGIGRDRLAELTIRGDRVLQMSVKVLTRAGEAMRVRHEVNRPNPTFETYHSAQFEMSVAPGRVIEGTVRAEDDGQPLAHATVTVVHRRVCASRDTLFVRGKTDETGHFRLVGMPIEAGTMISVFPQEQPYFGRTVKTEAGARGAVLRLDFRLTRGIVVAGKVTDKVTGKPVFGGVRYAAAADNPHIDEVNGFRALTDDEPYAIAREIAADGSFRLPVLPGRGVVMVHDIGPGYPGLNHNELQAFRSIPYLPAYGPVQAYQTVTVSPGSPPIHLDFTVDPGKTLSGTVLDPDGQPVMGIEVFGTLVGVGWTQLEKTANFTVHGLRPASGRSVSKLIENRSPEGIAAFIQPEPPRTLVFHLQARHLAAAVAVRSSDPEPLRVRLRPEATVTGRLVDADGQPPSDKMFQVYYLGFDLLDDYIFLPRFVRNADQDGRFKIEGLAPGLRLRLWPGDAVDRSRTFSPLRPGESRDLGDIKF